MSSIKDVLKAADMRKNKKVNTTERQIYGHVYVDKDVMQELKEFCAERHVFVKEVATALIEDFLDEQSYQRSRKKRV